LEFKITRQQVRSRFTKKVQQAVQKLKFIYETILIGKHLSLEFV